MRDYITTKKYRPNLNSDVISRRVILSDISIGSITTLKINCLLLMLLLLFYYYYFIKSDISSKNWKPNINIGWGLQYKWYCTVGI